jgi:hypothetical protein
MGNLGRVVSAAAARVDALGAADAALRQATLWSRPFVFVRHADWGIARATLAIYRPAVPTTVEGFAYAGVGIVVVLALYHLLVRAPVVRLIRKKGPDRAPAAP